jgi:hypothetical protein
VIDLICEGLQALAFMIVLTVLVMGVSDQLWRNTIVSLISVILQILALRWLILRA